MFTKSQMLVKIGTNGSYRHTIKSKVEVYASQCCVFRAHRTAKALYLELMIKRNSPCNMHNHTQTHRQKPTHPHPANRQVQYFKAIF